MKLETPTIHAQRVRGNILLYDLNQSMGHTPPERARVGSRVAREGRRTAAQRRMALRVHARTRIGAFYADPTPPLRRAAESPRLRPSWFGARRPRATPYRSLDLAQAG